MGRRGADVLITGGGTGGHVFPALAIAEALVAHGHARDRVQFVGARHGMEAELVPKAGFGITLLPGRGIVRRASPGNLRAFGGLAVALVRSIGIVARRRPAVVVSVGGYGGVACSLAAYLLRVPVVTVTVDAVPGAANRLVGRFARASAVAFPGSALPRAVVTGVPVSEAVLATSRSCADRSAARATLGIAGDRRVVAIVGGSLGSGRLNTAASGLRRMLSSEGGLVLYHVSGARDYDELVAADEGGIDGALDYRLVRFEEHLPALFAVADIVVSRAGAMTVAELQAIGTPSVLVPLPGAPSDHQTKNARALEAKGAAIVVEDGDATPERLGALLHALLADEPRRRAMFDAARSGDGRDAAASIAALVDEVASAPSTRAVGRQ